MNFRLTLLAALAALACHPAASSRAPSNSPPPMSGMAAPSGAPGQPTLFTRLGGMPAITAVVDAFTSRVGADERINAFFRGVDLVEFKRLLAEQLCAGTGGGCRYSGRSMQASHRGMDLTDAHFNALVEDLVATLNQFNVPAAEQQELLAVLGPMRGDIVGR